MSYVIGQYNKKKNIYDDTLFMTLITSGTASRRSTTIDSGVTGMNKIFSDECLQLTSLSNNKNYYFHGKIKRLKDTQIFNIKLVNYDVTGTENIEQFIKTIVVSGGGESPTDWVDVEFIFSPLITFDSILFELQRTADDFTKTRYPLIAYEELSEINNMINEKVKNNAKLIRIGVQSRPGLMMCINGEEIRTSRTGVYELKNGVITVNFFSVCAAIKEADDSIGTNNTMSGWIANINNSGKDILEYGNEYVNSKSFLNTSKQTRSIDSFTLDYMYRE